MMRVETIGRVLFALSLAGLGILSLLSGDFALDWQPVPAWLPGREALAYISGAVLLAFGLGILVDRTAKLSALVLTVDFFIWLLLLRFPKVKSLLDEGGWLGVGETAVLVAGAWTMLVMFAGQNQPAYAKLVMGSTGLRLCRILFGLALPLIGLSHIVFVKAAAGLVPAYFPAREILVYLTGIAHIAAGAAVLIAFVPRSAAILEGIMMVLFGLIVWAPRVAQAPMNRFDWTAMLVSITYGAASLIVAAAYKSNRLTVGDTANRPAMAD